MTYKEEQYARQLYKNLQQAFLGSNPTFLRLLGLTRQGGSHRSAISIKGAGVNWHCTVEKGSRSCLIHCFDIDFTTIAYKGPEYYSDFKTNGQTEATGRTFSEQDTITAASSWLQGQSLEEIYNHLAFVDIEKRKLRVLMTELTTDYPTLCEIQQCKIIEDYFLAPTLYFKSGNRGCSVECVDYDHHMQYNFTWDETLIFEIAKPDITQVGSLIEKWVVDAAQPSTLAAEFPAVNFGNLAPYYEQGNGIAGEFILSWDAIEQFYRESNLEIKSDILALIKQMRTKGFDKTLRAGQSLYTLILSRSRRHGLQKGQPAITFFFGNYGLQPLGSEMKIEFKNIKLSFEKNFYNDQVEKLLIQLQRHPID